MSKPLMGLILDIFTDEDFRGTRQRTADGGSGSLTLFGRKKSVTLVGEDVNGKPIPGVFEATPERPAVRIRVRSGGRGSVSVVPAEAPENMVGPMMGGAYVGGSDGRIADAFGFYGAVALHDRFETQARYNELST